MKEIDVPAGMYVRESIYDLLDHEPPCFIIFNGIKIEHLAIEDTTAQLYEQYRKAIDNRVNDYNNSADSKKAKENLTLLVAKNQDQVNKLLNNMPILKKEQGIWDHLETLSWVEKYIELIDLVGVIHDNHAVIQHFLSQGYLRNANINQDFNPDDKDNVARYLVGQFLNDLMSFNGNPHPIAIHMIKKWKIKFVRNND